MKLTLEQRIARGVLLAFVMASTLSVSAQSASEILLEIDPTNLAAVTITSTDNHSLIDDSSADGIAGIWLQGLFSTGGTVPSLSSSSNLTPAGNTVPYNQLYNDFFGVDVTDFGIYSNSSDFQNFQTTAAAFTGSLAADFSSSTSVFSSAGTTGEIRAGDSQNGSDALIGYYQIVPEPTSLSILACAGIMITRRRRDCLHHRVADRDI